LLAARRVVGAGGLARRIDDFERHIIIGANGRISIAWEIRPCLTPSSNTPRFWLVTKTVLPLKSASDIFVQWAASNVRPYPEQHDTELGYPLGVAG